MVDANDLVYLRARYYHPGLGVFTGLDPIEQVNRYQYVSSNPVNAVDPSGQIMESPGVWDNCNPQRQDACIEGCQDLMGQGFINCVKACEILERSTPSTRRSVLATYANELYSCLPMVVRENPIDYSIGQLVADPSRPSFDAGINDIINPATCDLDTTPSNAVDALAMLIEYGAQQFPNISTLELLSDITFVLFGNDDPRTLIAITGRGAEYTGDYVSIALDRHALTYEHSGFHDDFQDYHSQVFHFWPYFNTVAQNSWDGIALAQLADIEHECKEIDTCENRELPCVTGVNVGHVRDARLSTAAVLLGLRARSSSPMELAQDIRTTLSSPFTGELNPYYYTNQKCKWLAIEDLNERGLEWPSAYHFYRPSP